MNGVVIAATISVALAVLVFFLNQALVQSAICAYCPCRG